MRGWRAEEGIPERESLADALPEHPPLRAVLRDLPARGSLARRVDVVPFRRWHPRWYRLARDPRQYDPALVLHLLLPHVPLPCRRAAQYPGGQADEARLLQLRDGTEQ